MMYKSESSRAGRLRALALVPALAVALGLASVPAMRAAASTIRNSEVSVGKGNEKSPRSQENRPQFKVEKITHDGNGTTVILRGENLGNSATVSGGTLTTDGKTYHANSLNFTLSDGKGTIEARFDSAPAPVNPNVTITLNGQDFRVTTEN